MKTVSLKIGLIAIAITFFACNNGKTTDEESKSDQDSAKTEQMKSETKDGDNTEVKKQEADNVIQRATPAESDENKSRDGAEEMEGEKNVSKETSGVISRGKTVKDEDQKSLEEKASRER